MPDRCRGIALLLATAMALVSVVGCGLWGSEDPEVSKELGGRLVYGMTGEPDLFNPLLTADPQSSYINRLVYAGLVRYDEDLQIREYLAAGWEISEDKLSWTFYLQEDVQWHDGEPFTAEDVVFTYETLLDPDFPGTRQEEFLDLKGVEAVDDHTVRFQLDRPFSPFLSLLTMGILPQHLFSEDAPDGTAVAQLAENPNNYQPTGLGPYKWNDWDFGESLTLTANREFFLEGPWIETLTFHFISDQDRLLDKLREGELGYATSLPHGEVEDLKGALQDSHVFHRLPSHGYQYIGLHQDHPILSDIRVRQALMYGLNREAMVEDVFGGYATPLHSHYPPTSWVHGGDLNPYQYNPDRAKELLEDAGWSPGSEGPRRDSQGSPLSFSLVAADHSRENRAVVEHAESHWSELGVQLRPEYQEWAQLLDRYVERSSFDSYLLGWTLGLDPDSYVFFHSSQSQLTRDGYVVGLNDVAFRHDRADELLEEGRWHTENDDRLGVYTEFQEILNRQLPYLFLYTRETVIAVDSRVKGVTISPLGPVFPERWFLETGP